MLRGRAVHVPSVAQIRLWKTFFLRRPVLSIYYHNGLERDIYYPPTFLQPWESMIQDATRITYAMDTFRTALSHIPMYPEKLEASQTQEKLQ